MLSNQDLRGYLPDMEEDDLLKHLGSDTLMLENILAELEPKNDDFISNHALQPSCDLTDSKHSEYISTDFRHDFLVLTNNSQGNDFLSSDANTGNLPTDISDCAYSRPSCSNIPSLSFNSLSLPSMSSLNDLHVKYESGFQLDCDLASPSYTEACKNVNRTLRTRTDSNNNRLIKVQKTSNPMLRRALSSPQADVFSSCPSVQLKLLIKEEKRNKLISRSLSSTVQNNKTVKLEFDPSLTNISLDIQPSGKCYSIHLLLFLFNLR